MKRPPEAVAFSFGVKEAGQMLPLLADRARSECARSMRAVGSTCTHSAVIKIGEEERPPTKAAFLLRAQWILSSKQSPRLWGTIGWNVHEYRGSQCLQLSMKSQ